MSYELPKAVEINGEEFAIRYDFRVILDLFEVLNDVDLDDREKAYAMLQIFYVDADRITDPEEAIRACFRFINGGKDEEGSRRQPKLIDWEKDFRYIVAPVNRILGYETRDREYDLETNTGGVHWWTFLSAYLEIGDCLFAQIVRVREKRAKGKPLDKADQEFYRRNRELVDLVQSYSAAENDLVKQWTRG